MRNQLLVLCLVVSGCSFDIKTCTTDDDCVAGGYCGEGGFCVAREEQTGGGAGGGAGGGGGAQTTGGGAQVGGGSATGGGEPTGGGGTSNLCDGGCPVWEECTSDSVCVDIGLELSWATPDGGSRFGPNQTVPLKLSVSRADGGALPVSIPFALVGTTTSSLAGPSYVGSVQLTNASGTKTLWAGWDGGPSTTTTFNIDSIPPTLSFVTESGYHQRDAVIYGILRADDAIVDSGVSLGGVAMTAVATSQCASLDFGGSVLDKACYELDLSKPALLMLDGGVPVVLSATDTYENSTAQDGGATLVTRLRWASQVAAAATSIQALVVGSDGMIYAGTEAAGSDPTLLKVAPNGAVLLDGGLGDVQSLAIDNHSGTDVLYASFIAGNAGNIGAVKSDTLNYPTVGYPKAPCSGANGSVTYSGIALYKTDAGGDVLAVGSINSGSAGFGCLYNPNGPPQVFQSNGKLDAFNWVGQSLTAAPNVVVHNDVASFLADNSAFLNFNSCVWYGIDLTNPAGTPASKQLSGLTSGGGAACTGQAHNGVGSLATTKQNALAGDEVFFIRPDAGVTGGTLGGVHADRGVPSLVASNLAIVGQGNDVVAFDPTNVDAGATPVVTGVGAVRGAPVLGAPRSFGDAPVGYAATTPGVLVAFNHSSNNELWRASVTGAGESFVGHLAFDINRGRCSSRTGLLYLGTNQGRVYAVVVDTPALIDEVGSWPKYQRTAGNAGNSDPYFPINWPGCP